MGLSVDDAARLFRHGVDKIVVNTLLETAPGTVRDLVRKFGSQAVVGSIDFRHKDGKTESFTEGGTRSTGLDLEEACRRAVDLGVGELYLTSIDRDGTGQGYDLRAYGDLCRNLPVPVVVSGGVGRFDHLQQGIRDLGADAVSTANLFNFMGEGLADARQFLLEQGVELPRHKPFAPPTPALQEKP